MADVTSPASIKRSGSAIEIVKPIKTPKTITFISLSNLPRKSPIIDPISDTEISTPVRKTPSPTITPTHPKKKLIRSPFSTPTKKFKITTKIAMGITDLDMFLISSKKIMLTFFRKIFIKKEQPKLIALKLFYYLLAAASAASLALSAACMAVMIAISYTS